jgi:HD-like signal output (HDOD) protein
LRDIGHFVLYQTVPQRAQSALIEADSLDNSLAEVEQSNIGCDFAEVGAELICTWGMPPQIDQAVRYQLSPSEAGDCALHASIVHIAGVVADHEELEPNRRHEVLPFDPFAITTTQFKDTQPLGAAHRNPCTTQDTLALIHPSAMAA